MIMWGNADHMQETDRAKVVSRRAEGPQLCTSRLKEVSLESK